MANMGIWVKGLVALCLLAGAAGGIPAPVGGQGNERTYLPLVARAPQTLCRFGMTTVKNVPGYLDLAHLAQLRSGALIDWDIDRPAAMPSHMRYVHIIGTGRHYLPNTPEVVAAKVQQYPGAVWQVGNEPDRKVYQDEATPEEYAQQYFAIAQVIRANDPQAKIAFGSIVQPTKIRLRYLDRAWARLEQLAGGTAQASALIDIWSIHAFILNEKGTWGAEVPPGLVKDIDYVDADLFSIDVTIESEIKKTYDVNILKGFVSGFRAWMNAKGERNKPLWISEYGSAFPAIDKPPPEPMDYYNVSDADTAAFMVASFDYFRTAADGITGYPQDNNLLVQRWFWFSQNEYRYNFGGTLFDPDTGVVTAVGQAYMNYTAGLPADGSCWP